MVTAKTECGHAFVSLTRGKASLPLAVLICWEGEAQAASSQAASPQVSAASNDFLASCEAEPALLESFSFLSCQEI